ncbi:formate dehydrogenase chain D [Bacillus sp. JCM 19046]|nr:formate dehydrogenase chain D [Bacillus sp. JCM 19046]
MSSSEGKVYGKREVTKYADGEQKTFSDTVAVEVPITIKVNGEEFVTVVCSPEYIEDMVIGYLASEGVIDSFRMVQSIRYDQTNGYVHVSLSRELSQLHQLLQGKRYITSCCGMSRQGFIFASDSKTTKTMKSRNVHLTDQECFKLMNELQSEAHVFKQTGGVHNAALATKDGIVLMRMDIGRHNALDKLYGYCLRNGISLTDKVMLFSGRLSSEILLKVAKIGCEIVLSKSAPTDRALMIAEELEITAVGFIRAQSMNVYTCSERIYQKAKSSSLLLF